MPINNESPESLLRAECCCWCDCVYHLCPGYHVFVHSHHFALHHLPLICFWISQSSNNFGFLACILWNNWGFPQVCQSLTSHPIFSLPIGSSFYFVLADLWFTSESSCPIVWVRTPFATHFTIFTLLPRMLISSICHKNGNQNLLLCRIYEYLTSSCILM